MVAGGRKRCRAALATAVPIRGGWVRGVGLAAAIGRAVAGRRLGTGRHVSRCKAATCRRTPQGGRVPAGGVSGRRARFGIWTLLRVTDPRSGGGRWLVHRFLAEYGRVREKIIRAHSALGWEGRGYWGKVGSKNGNLPESGKLI